MPQIWLIVGATRGSMFFPPILAKDLGAWIRDVSRIDFLGRRS